MGQRGVKPFPKSADLDFHVTVIAQTGYEICGFTHNSPGEMVIFNQAFGPVPFFLFPHKKAEGHRGP
jgi:hypothetical protein